MFGKHHTKEARDKSSKSHKGIQDGEKNPMYGVRFFGKQNHFYGKHHTITTRKKLSEIQSNRIYESGWHHPDETRLRIIESHTGGFWYGAVRYKDRVYCELWCQDLFHRIDEAQNYQSILSGKTKEDNGGRALSRHHVYWQPKACCEWDEDTRGYYAMINIGTNKNPNWHKHYIRGDPNKFVLLTMSEHRMVPKDKLKWIKILEDLIETELGGVCYLPKVKQ